MCRNRVYIFLGILCLFLLAANKPKNNLEELSEKIISLLTGYVDENPEEKVFLHLDKDHYAAGEDIWFSVYLTAGSPDIPSPLSKTVYVDMLDNGGKLIEQKTIKIQEGHGFGDFKLPYFIPEGIYHIKAYSTWLRGFGEDQVFARTIDVLEPLNMNFQPQVTFNLGPGEEEGDVKYVGSIKAVNKDLRPLREKKLKYELFTSRHILGEGNLALNGEGAVDLEVFLKESDLHSTVFLKLIYEENENFQINRLFRLPFPESVIDLQFMPEGGEIIEGFANKVAFRAVYPDGSPADIKGELRGPKGFVKSFETNSNGLGQFTFTPQNADYQAYLLGQNEDLPIGFPEIQSRGVNLTVDARNPELLNMLIQAKDYASLDAHMEGLLVVHARGRIGFMQKLNLAQGVAGARVNKTLLSPGINQITVFNSEGQPLAERLVFVGFEDLPAIDIHAETKDLKAKGKNLLRLKLDAENFEGGKYSVSITDASALVSNNASNIITYLKFSSELKGKVSDRELYVNGKLDPDAVDLIMLTNGWRRFNWENIFVNNYTNRAHIEQGINVMGTIKPKYKSKRGLEGGTLNVLLRGLNEEFIVADFSESGKFILDALDFQDTTTLVLSAEDGRQKKMLEISVDPPLSKKAKWEHFEPLFRSHIINPELREFLQTAQEKRMVELNFDGDDEILMEEFVVKGNQLVDEEDGITRIYGKGDHVLRVADYPDANENYTIAQLIRGRLPGVSVIPVVDEMGQIVMPPQSTFKIQGVFVPLVKGNPPPPLLLVDSQEVDFEQFTALNPRDVLTVEVFLAGQSNARFGSITDNGVIAVYTKGGGGIYSSEGVFHTKYPGYSTSREYYSPRYEEEESKGQPDLRNTLYWNPELSWNGKETEIEFFNNDKSDKFRVVVQGIDRFGRLSYAEKVIN